MTKEILGSLTSGICGGCNIHFAFLDYHWPHCKMNPNNLKGADKKYMESKFTKSELATIASTGPMSDAPIRGRRKRVRA